MGQIFSLVFVKDFPHRWPSFFTDLVGTLSMGQVAVEFYLIVLSAMDTEVSGCNIFSPKLLCFASFVFSPLYVSLPVGV